ncbi:MAG TPA: bifunctional hydroxymethylpyrimidine kinase/phosphomethylpyrimidine kinase [Opitutaceae bacterium]|jgi:hydroxymethylpyrimidine/phosphomethylpyrimidine kinase
MNSPLCILTIAGSDSGGGAGIQSDIRTIRALGGHALTAVTAVTAQDTRRISAWKPVAESLIQAQVESALSGFTVGAAKTGLLPGPGAVRAVAKALARHPTVPLVVDPVLSSSGGTAFLSPSAAGLLRRLLLPRAVLSTPNWPEAAILARIQVRSHEQAARAAAKLAEETGRPVLVKGGHSRGPECRDCLALPGGGTVWFTAERIQTPNTHGTGCVLSAAIATWIGRGADLMEAVRLGHSFLQSALVRGRGLDWGGGRGPAFFGSR